MSEHVIQAEGLRWIDLVDPTRAELQSLAERYPLHHTSIQDCLDPEHLPKFERIGEVSFVILRAYDETCSPDGDSVQELTRKVAIFSGPGFVITVHRRDQPYLATIRARWEGRTGPRNGDELVLELLRAAVTSFEKPIDVADQELGAIETVIFTGKSQHAAIEQGYYVKRKAAVFKRMLRLSLDVIARLSVSAPSPLLQDLRENAERMSLWSEELVDDANNLLNLQISLASHRTNEVVRVLTLFSVFFLPLNFIAGIYGMNFRHMPELEWAAGYPFALALMTSVGLGLFLWFRGKGWLR